MNTVGIGVFGVGKMGQAHVHRINESLRGARVVAVSDPAPEFAHKAAPGLGLSDDAVEESAAALCARPDVEAILIAAWDGEHEAAALEAIKAGKMVFCEKPLTPSVEGCRRIVAAEARAGRRLLQVGFMRRYDAGYQQLKKVLDDGTVGDPLLAYCMHRNPSQGDKFESGQIITQVMVHEFDISRWLFGEEVTRVRVDRSRTTSKAHEGLIDPLTAVLWTESGLRINVEAVCFDGYAYDIRCDILCEEGGVALPDELAPTIRDAHGVRHQIGNDWLDRFKDAYNTEVQAWIDSVIDGQQSGPSAWDGYAAQAVCETAGAAMETGAEHSVELIARPGIYA